MCPRISLHHKGPVGFGNIRPDRGTIEGVHRGGGLRYNSHHKCADSAWYIMVPQRADNVDDLVTNETHGRTAPSPATMSQCIEYSDNGSPDP